MMVTAGDVIAAVVAAAATDPEVVELAETTERRRRMGAASVVESVRSVGALRPGLSEEEAVDVLWLLNSPAVYWQLVRRGGWSPDAYERWLAGAMVCELLS